MKFLIHFGTDFPLCQLIYHIHGDGGGLRHMVARHNKRLTPAIGCEPYIRMLQNIIFLVDNRVFTAQQKQAIIVIQAADLIRHGEFPPGSLDAFAGRTVRAAADALAFGAFRLFAQDFGEILEGAIFIAAQIDHRIAVADDSFPVIFEQALQLGNVLQDNVAADVSAAAHGKNVFEVFRQSK